MIHHRISPVQGSRISIAGLTAEQIYLSQKEELLESLQRVLDTAFPLDFDVQAIARLMHNLAGTSAYFCEDHIGMCAARLEHPLRTTSSTDEIHALCARMLGVLR